MVRGALDVDFYGAVLIEVSRCSVAARNFALTCSLRNTAPPPRFDSASAIELASQPLHPGAGRSRQKKRFFASGTAKIAQSRLFSRTVCCFFPEKLSDFVQLCALVRLKLLNRNFLAVPSDVSALKTAPIL